MTWTILDYGLKPDGPKNHMVHSSVKNQVSSYLEQKFDKDLNTASERDILVLDPGGVIDFKTDSIIKEFDQFGKVETKPEHILNLIYIFAHGSYNISEEMTSVSVNQNWCVVMPNDLYRQVSQWLISLMGQGLASQMDMAAQMMFAMGIEPPEGLTEWDN